MKAPILGLAAILFLAGCGGVSGSGGGGGQGISVEVTSPAGAGAVDDGLTLPITVKVNNDSGNAGVTWTVAAQHKGDPTGTLSDVQPTSVTYTPPAGITGTLQVTVTATSVTDPTRSALIPIAVYPAVGVSTMSSDLTTAFLNTDYTCIQLPITSEGVVQIPCQITATGGLAPFTWSVDNTQLPPGLFLGPGLTPSTSKIVGTPTLPGIFPFKVNVTDSLGGKTSASLTVNVAPQQLKVVTPTIMTVRQGVSYPPVALLASGGVPPYTWTLANGSGPLPPGMTLSPSGVIGGIPATEAGFFFAVQVSDSQTPVPAQAVFPTPSPSNAKIITLTGTALDPTCFTGGSTIQTGTPYAFSATGFDSAGPVTISGSFTSDSSGNLTGVEDVIRAGNAQLGLPLTSGSTIAFNQVGRGCVTLTSAAGSVQLRAAPTTIAPGSSGAFFPDGRLMEFDDNDGTGTRLTGFFRMQDPAAFSTDALTGPFAFRFAGWDHSGGHFAMAGTTMIESGSLSSVAADVNDGGVTSGPMLGGNGSLGSIDSNGRGTATINTGTGTYALVFYVVDAAHLVLNSVQPAGGGHPLMTGEAIAATSGPFSEASLTDSHIFRFGGHNPGSPDVGIGVLHFDGAGAASGELFERSGGSSTATSVAAQYSVDPATGRFTFSGTGIPTVGYAIPGTSGVTAFLVGTGSSASSGTMEFQTNSYPPGYLSSPISGRYGFAVEDMLDASTATFAGQETDDTNGGTDPASYIDINFPSNPGLDAVQSFTMFRYTFLSDGSGTYGGNTFMVTNGAKIFYIDTEPANVHPAVVVGQRQQAP